jgi:hypothetical protein
MALFLNVMRSVAEEFDKLYIAGDLGIIATAAIFGEHCKQQRKPIAYSNAKKIEKGRQEFLMQETIKCLFIEENHARWLNNITHPLRQSHVVTIPTEEEPANIFSPLHLIVDALATRFV